jgi:hypothetical protein
VRHAGRWGDIGGSTSIPAGTSSRRGVNGEVLAVEQLARATVLQAEGDFSAHAAHAFLR